MKKTSLLVLCYILILFSACGPVADLSIGGETDVCPPQFICIRAIDVGKIEVVFNETARIETETLRISPLLEITDISTDESSIIIHTEAMKTGEKYSLAAVVSDQECNSLSFAAIFYGYNPVKPRIIINEFTTQGSKAHPDLVELKVLSDGNMGGLTFYQGVRADWTDRFVFPAFAVKQGDFILLHFKPENTPAEINETLNKTESGGLDASASAFDFWIKEATGISGNNGVLSLYDQPHGEIIDGIFYSNRTADSDDSYQGFGSTRNKERAFALYDAGAWTSYYAYIRPEDGINPDLSSATRSLCRSSMSTDTDSRNDWHIVPTRKASFGEENCDEEYDP
ncbi:MAG: hypothetical protein JW822_06950 [Spirochaetales bacterium]|nr:hypothetical protein [Spirochaetales bacterium]